MHSFLINTKLLQWHDITERTGPLHLPYLENYIIWAVFTPQLGERNRRFLLYKLLEEKKEQNTPNSDTRTNEMFTPHKHVQNNLHMLTVVFGVFTNKPFAPKDCNNARKAAMWKKVLF